MHKDQSITGGGEEVKEPPVLSGDQLDDISKKALRYVLEETYIFFLCHFLFRLHVKITYFPL